MAGLGTTGTMVAATACMFFLASTLIAFNSWSDSAISDQIQSLFVGDQQSSAAFPPTGSRVVGTSVTAAAASVAPVRTARPAESTAAGGPSERATEPGPAGTRDEPSSAPALGTDGTGLVSQVSDTAPAPSPRPVNGGSHSEEGPTTSDHAVAPSLGGVVQNTTDTLAGTVEQTTGQLGSTVGGINQPLGDVVTQTGQGLGSTISYTGQTLGSVLNGHR